jgi:hypothetical protein
VVGAVNDRAGFNIDLGSVRAIVGTFSPRDETVRKPISVDEGLKSFSGIRGGDGAGDTTGGGSGSDGGTIVLSMTVALDASACALGFIGALTRLDVDVRTTPDEVMIAVPTATTITAFFLILGICGFVCAATAEMVDVGGSCGCDDTFVCL